ncbi:hypothetical protein AXJ10_gp71 [Gordonia phage GordTnk2]|uniref:Uncharacterized protein n=2 Tax=Gordtnkvirus gordtnk2 TaxID=1982219 RepID=A0A0E3XAH0_9CAUD|nr:hypothetical protein AXJ11_gp70 [Gordonia phage GordDuk1]YP_009223979.1 hypothetical protein AXJ10_gp71 [Gordonia phage GordTnk2]AKC02811.1 hypothetical protein GordTnk2_71 [Gordonia phage GordTnk2]AKC02998.1 hypothetical protein GordDuk1_70 [Gordonia phage GordDuk1]
MADKFNKSLNISSRDEYLSSHPWVSKVRGPRLPQCEYRTNAGGIDQCGNRSAFRYVTESGKQFYWCSRHLERELDLNDRVLSRAKKHMDHHLWSGRLSDNPENIIQEDQEEQEING